MNAKYNQNGDHLEEPFNSRSAKVAFATAGNMITLLRILSIPSRRVLPIVQHTMVRLVGIHMHYLFVSAP